MGKKYHNEQWLREKYHGETLSTREIAELADCTAPTIQDWLDRHGIEKRSKSEAAKIRAEKYPHTTQAGAEALKEHGVNSWEYWDEEEREAFRERLSKERQGDNNPMADVTGKDHHNYKENPTPQRFYQSARWKETRREVLERDNHECQACGATENLDVHHIQPVSAGGPRFELNNLVTLCDAHHKEWEGLYLRPDTRGQE
jgi:hypothetical protein